VPSQQWKIRTTRQKWYPGETISVAIGQGALTVTPLQLAAAIGGLAVGGHWYPPHLLKSLTASEKPHDWNVKQDEVDRVKDGMYGVVEVGTGGRAKLPGIEVCGKTGSVYESAPPGDECVVCGVRTAEGSADRGGGAI